MINARKNMRCSYFRGVLRTCTAMFLAGTAAISLTTSVSAEVPRNELRTLLEFPPATLNPRLTSDATGQRLNMLLFRALTRVDANLAVQPDLAESWTTSTDKKQWFFKLGEKALDHAHQPIQAEDLKACLEEYLNQKPVSPLKTSFPNFVRAEVKSKNVLQIILSAPDPFLVRNLSVLRFFRVQGESRPCKNPDSKQILIGSGDYRLVP